MGQLRLLYLLRAPQSMKRSQVGLGVWAVKVVGTSESGMSGQQSGTGTHIVLCPSLGSVIWSVAGTPERQNPVGFPGVQPCASSPALEGVSWTHLFTNR